MHRSGSDQWIRGGQATQHWFRMGLQVIKTTIQVGAAVFAVSYAVLCYLNFTLAGMHTSYAHFLSAFLVESRGVPDALVRFKDPIDGWIERTASDIYNDANFTQIASEYELQAVSFGWWSLAPALVAALLAALVFMFSGKRLEGDSHVRGTRLVETSELKKWVQQKWKAYRKQFGKGFKTGPMYTIGGIQFPPNAVEAQTAICGTVGSGKSNLMKEMAITIRENGGKAIIYDRMGSFVRDFYDPKTDIIVNPFDSRSVSWSPFHEATGPEFFTQMAEVLIPDRQGSSDPFWSQAARIVFDYAAATLFKKDNPTNKDLRDAILQIPSSQLAELIDQTPGRHFFNEEIAKTADSIRANLIAELRFLEFLRDDGDPFSIREWVMQAETGFVFLTADAEHAAANRNIISTIFEVGANALMTCPESNDPKIWFLMDELPTLNRMPFLPRSLAQIRQFGGAFLIGYQVFSQLEEIYGDKGAKTIAGNLNNRVVFNTPDADTAEIFSKSLGSEDVLENRDSISVGAHETRDGIGIMSQRTERRIVTASQIQSLPQFQGYVRFAYDAPTAFVSFDPVNVEPVAEKFVQYHGRGFGNGDMSSAPSSPPLPPSDGSGTSADILQIFQKYLDHLKTSGLQIYADEKYKDMLWDHFYVAHTKGVPIVEIGPPSNKVAHMPLMRAPRPQSVGLSQVTENVPTAPIIPAPPVQSTFFDEDGSSDAAFESVPQANAVETSADSEPSIFAQIELVFSDGERPS